MLLLAAAVGGVSLLPRPASAQLNPASLIVEITAPAPGSTVSNSTPVSARVTIVGLLTVAGVQFRLDGVNLGAEDRSSPYAISWNTRLASNGTHTLTAVARDHLGIAWTSNPVTVTVFNDTTPPSVTVTSPAAGTTVGGTVSVAATATDNVGVAGVRFRVNGVPAGPEDTVAPYTIPWDTTAVANGSYTLAATARDAAGNEATASIAITVFNDTTPPSVTVTSPADGATVRGTVVVSAAASDDGQVAGVRFAANGVDIAGEDLSAPYEIVWDTTTTTDGPHTLTAVARDAAGRSAESVPVTVTVANGPDEVTRRIEETDADVVFEGTWARGNTARPWSGGTAAFASLSGVTARATLGFTGSSVSWIGFRGPLTGIANVYVDGALAATVDTYAAAEEVGATLYTASGLPSGPHAFTVEATGTRNPASSDPFVVVDAFDVTGPPEIDTVPPSVAISWPKGGAGVWGRTAVTALATDDESVMDVRFFVDGIEIGVDAAAPYSIVWNTETLTDGAHTLTAVARDGGDNAVMSAAVTVAVQNTAVPPAPPATRVENTEGAISYTLGSTAPGQPPAWFHGSRSRDWSGGTASFNRAINSRAVFPFSGTGVSWVGFSAYWAGIAYVYLDDVFVAEIDLFRPPCTPEARAQGCIDERAQDRIFTARDLQPGPHTLVIESTGLKHGGHGCGVPGVPGPACSADYAVVVDAFDVVPASVPAPIGARSEDGAAVYSGAWARDTARPWSGGEARTSATASAQATFTFVGTEARWIGLRSPASGIADVYLDGAFHARVDTYSPFEIQGVVFAATGLAPAQHTLRIVSTGLKNAAASSPLVAVDALDVRARFEDADAAVAYTGTWAQGHMDSAWSGTSGNAGSGTAARSATGGAAAEFTFHGTEVRWIAARGPWGGIAEVSVDDGAPVTVDLYAPAEELRMAVFTASGLAADTVHRLRIGVTGRRHAAATSAIVVVDAFDVAISTPAPATRRVQQTDAAVTYTGDGWTLSTGSPLYSGGTTTQSITPGTRAEFSFTGTGVRWVGDRHRDSGIANVYLDGAFVAEVDTFAAQQDEYQATLFTASGLAAGPHRLTIEVTDRKHGGETCTPSGGPLACSAGHRIVLDAFDVQ